MSRNFNTISKEEQGRILEMAIRKVIKEETESLSVGDSFLKGQDKTLEGGLSVGKSVKQSIIKTVEGATETIINIGSVIIKIVFLGVGVVVIIGKTLLKITEVIAKALIKFLTSCGKVVITAGKVVGKATIKFISSFIDGLSTVVKGIGSFISGLVDGASKVVIFCLKALKQFGLMFWGKILVMASTISEFGQSVWKWCKEQFSPISKKIGIGWDSAVNLAKKGWDSVKNLGSKALDFGKNVANKVSDVAGQTYGALKGFAQGLFEDSILFYETYISLKGKDTMTLLEECSKITKNVVL